MESDYEKLGAFYLGRVFDAATGKQLEPPEIAAAEGRTKPVPAGGEKKGKKQKASRSAK